MGLFVRAAAGVHAILGFCKAPVVAVSIAEDVHHAFFLDHFRHVAGHTPLGCPKSFLRSSSVAHASEEGVCRPDLGTKVLFCKLMVVATGVYLQVVANFVPVSQQRPGFVGLGVVGAHEEGCTGTVTLQEQSYFRYHGIADFGTTEPVIDGESHKAVHTAGVAVSVAVSAKIEEGVPVGRQIGML